MLLYNPDGRAAELQLFAELTNCFVPLQDNRQVALPFQFDNLLQFVDILTLLLETEAALVHSICVVLVLVRQLHF